MATTAAGLRVLRAGTAGFATSEKLPMEDSPGCEALAMRPNGAAVMVAEGELDEHRISAARRAPGAVFGAAEALTGTLSEAPEDLTAQLSTDGDAVVMWSLESGNVRSLPYEVSVEVASARAHGAFSAPTRLGRREWFSSPALAVAPDGRALVALADGTSLFVAERPPAGAFGAPVRVAAAADDFGVATSIAIGSAGDAAVAWRDLGHSAVSVVTRRAGGTFGAPVTVVPAVPLESFDPFYWSETYSASILPAGNNLAASNPVRTTLTPDGRAVLAWVGPRVQRGIVQQTARLATVPLGGGPAVSHTAGGVLENADAAFPLVLADGTPALAWTKSYPGGDSRLHLALEGAQSGAEPSAPRVRVGAPTKTVLKSDDALTLSVTCSGPCLVRAQVVNAPRAGDTLELTRAGSGRLHLYAGPAPIAPRRRGRCASASRTARWMPGSRTSARSRSVSSVPPTHRSRA